MIQRIAARGASFLGTFAKWFSQPLPQNYIIRRPWPGALLTGLFLFLFMLLYKPLNAHASTYMPYALTMAVYSALIAVALPGMLFLIKRIRGFSDNEPWSFRKEVFTILMLLTGMGLVTYFAAFFVEAPSNRWNLATFMDSLFRTFAVGVIPFAFFTVINLHRMGRSDNTSANIHQPRATGAEEPFLYMPSRLKKEQLSFRPSACVYAESDGNYVHFFLAEEDRLHKRTIRNSISRIEQELAGDSRFFRCHRAFIINLQHVTKCTGNASGYRLQLRGISGEIPVSRNNAVRFDQAYAPYTASTSCHSYQK